MPIPGLQLNPVLDRRQLLIRGLALAAGALPAASLLAACGDGNDMMDGSMPDWMMSEGDMNGPEMMEDMRVIRGLLVRHERIRRTSRMSPTGSRDR